MEENGVSVITLEGFTAQEILLRFWAYSKYETHSVSPFSSSISRFLKHVAQFHTSAQ